jgi:diacylglycerol O-acyltransferase
MADERKGSANFTRKMTDAEALMWSAEQDPMFSSTIGTLLICDGPVGRERLRRRMAAAVAEIPRLRHRVVPARAGRRGPPEWRTDPDFELDYHVRHVGLPAPGDQAQLLELTTRLMQDPFDRTRPLWQFVAIDGLEGARGGLLVKLHHTISDGQGAVRLAERYMDVDRDGFVPPEVDLDGLIAASVAAEQRGEAEEAGDEAESGVGGGGLPAASGSGRKLGLLRRLAGEAALTMADPGRLPQLAEDVGGGLRQVIEQLVPGEPEACSPLWRNRSRRRRLEVLHLPFRAAKDAGAALGGSLNDFFVAGSVEGAARYHAALGTPVSQLTLTFIVSTRAGRTEGGNAFTPSKAVVPATPMEPAERFTAVREVLAARKAEVGGQGLLAGVAGVANLLPPSLTNRLARAQAGAVDFASSNVRAAPFDVYIAGAKVLATFPIGPVAGTAWNLTMMSYTGRLHLGLHVDPTAVDDVELLVSCLQEGYDALLEAGREPACTSLSTW